MSEGRVLHMGPAPDTRGGMPAALRALLASPLAARYRLEVIATYRDARPLARLWRYCLALLGMTAWSLGGRGRIVHVHATVRGSAYRKSVCVLLARALRRRVVLQVHSGAGDIAAFGGSRGRLSLALFGAAFRAADAVIAVSQASAEALRAAGVEVPLEVVPNAAPLPPAAERPRRGEGPVRVAYLGGFANRAKGGDVLLDALALLDEPRPELTLAGPGEPPLGAEAALGDGGGRWIGWLEPADKDELLAGSDVFVMPSRSEGLPMALLEAMGHSLAIVATSAGGIPELVEDEVDGLLVPPEDPAALAAAISRLVADRRLRERLGAAARARAERLDDFEVGERLERIYERLA